MLETVDFEIVPGDITAVDADVVALKYAQQFLFDVRGQRCLTYERIKDLEEALGKELRELKSKGL